MSYSVTATTTRVEFFRSKTVLKIIETAETSVIDCIISNVHNHEAIAPMQTSLAAPAPCTRKSFTIIKLTLLMLHTVTT